MATFINEKAFVAEFSELLKKEMMRAAEPIIQKALLDIQQQMRTRLASVILSASDFYSVETMGREIRIIVRMEK